MATRPAPAPPRPVNVPNSTGAPSRPAPNAPNADHRGSVDVHEVGTYGTAPAVPKIPSGGSKDGKQINKIGQYVLGSTLGVGSFGKVKLATHSITGHKVAMKIINRRKIQNMDMTSRVKREIQYLKVLRHPHIIKLYEVITTPTDIIMVIEYAGGELFNYIVEKGRMPESEARRFFQQIICAIEYCHRHKIVHRDLKPENLLLDDYLNVKIGDFGLSNIMQDGDFLKTSCGSPNYAAPEVISGRLYAGPEIDIWSCGVILYVMLCGKLPFDDEYIPALFKKINGGIFSLPSHLSDETRHLLTRMLVVDPVKRATIAEIRANPWFQENLPHYLQPLPPTPSLQTPNVPVGELRGLLGAQPGAEGAELDESQQKLAEARGLIYTHDLGIVDPEIVDELCEKMAGFDRSDVWDALKKEGDNQIKVAYQLVRDHKRMLEDSARDYDDEHVMESFLASSPPPWNAGLETAQGVNRSTSLKHRHTKSTQSAQEYDSWDEEDIEIEDIPGAHFATLETSLPGRIDENGEPIPEFDVPALGAQNIGSYDDAGRAAHSLVSSQRAASTPRAKKEARARWHFGIRSRSPPMEVMHEIYKTLQTLGMEWKRKPGYAGPWDEYGRPIETPAQAQANKELSSSSRKEKKQKEKQQEEKNSQALFFVETRCRIGDVVVRMDLQLYRVDAENYLVDFRNVGYYRTDPDQPGFSRVRRGSQQTDNDSAQGKDIVAPELKASSSVEDKEDSAKISEVCSPFLFLEAACRLIVELASG